MTKTTLTVAVCATLLWAGTALAVFTASPQQKCDYSRITAWKAYVSCVDTAVAKDAKGVSFDDDKAFAKCRHTYFKKWTAFQGKASYAGSSCDQTVLSGGGRFTDNLDQTVTDNLSGLVWEKKDNASGIHDKDNVYTWSTGSPFKENGTAFTTFLWSVNSGGGFAGANGWRLPTLVELQTIMLDFACTGAGCSCPSTPCVDPALDATNTQSHLYWSATTLAGGPGNAWGVGFSAGDVGYGVKIFGFYVRAVRGGL